MLDKTRTGSTLVFVLIIMLVIMTITTTVTSIIINTVRTNTAYEHNAMALYAMESGTERALYYFNQARSEQILSLASMLDNITALTGQFNNRSNYYMTVNEQSATAIDLVETEAMEWNVYQENDQENYYNLEPLPNLSRLSFTWSEANTCPTGTSQIQVSFTSWTATEWEDLSSPNNPTTHYTVTCPAPQACQYDLGLDATHLYRVRLRALQCDINDVRAIPRDTFGNSIALTDSLNIKVTGEQGRIMINGGTNTPLHAGLLRYFDYVLFSEAPVSQ